VFAAKYAAILACTGCFDVRTAEPAIPIEPDATGWVARGTNPLGVSGFWYAYGDQYDEPRRCTGHGQHPEDIGLHELDQCSFVTTPPAAPALSFANVDGKLCTVGNVAKVNSCQPLACDDDNLDYSNMWGAGIGLDFGLPADDGEPPTERNVDARATWNALAHGVTGVSFDFSWNDPTVHAEPYVRVGFPMLLPEDDPDARVIEKTAVLRNGKVLDPGQSLPPGTTSEDHPSGSPFADAPPAWTTDNITSLRDGYNEIRWSRVKAPPESHFAFDPTALYGIIFQVPTSKSGRLPYSFCVANLALLRD
jgi:hypothetical protein